MKRKRESGARLAGLILALGCVALTSHRATADENPRFAPWIVGTWYLALDTEPFGLPPDLPLSGLAIFSEDGTYQLQDGGDFGQATFLNARHSTQFGAWRRTKRGDVVGSALFLEAELSTGEVLRWQKVRLVLKQTDDPDVISGTSTVSVLDCSNMLPLPTAATCPDPVESRRDFVIMPPTGVPLTLRRVRPLH